jgi:hypothetical protein
MPTFDMVQQYLIDSDFPNPSSGIVQATLDNIRRGNAPGNWNMWLANFNREQAGVFPGEGDQPWMDVPERLPTQAPTPSPPVYLAPGEGEPADWYGLPPTQAPTPETVVPGGTVDFGTQIGLTPTGGLSTLAPQPRDPTFGDIPIEQARREREKREVRYDVFREFLATNPQFQNVNPLVRRSTLSRFKPLEETFRLTTADPQATFFDFLAGGGRELSPAAAAQQIANVAGFVDIAGQQGFDRTPAQKALFERFGPNAAAFDASLSTLLPGVTAAFRPAFTSQARDIFDRFQGEDPRGSFLDFLGRRGGNIFGAVGSSGDPFQAFAR